MRKIRVHNILLAVSCTHNDRRWRLVRSLHCLVPKQPHGEGQSDAGDEEQGDVVADEVGGDGAFQVDAPHGLDGEAQRVDVGEDLQDARHVGDGCCDP